MYNMDFLKRVLLIFALTTIFSLHSANCCELTNIKYDVGTISAPISIENDFLNSKNNEFSLNAVSNNQTIATSRRNDNNQGSSSNDEIIEPLKQEQKLISYIHNQAYLEDKNELALLLLLHQIQPNAP